jgi:hypothetical protein
MFDYDTKEKEHQNTRKSDLYSGATPHRTIKSDIARFSMLVSPVLNRSGFKITWPYASYIDIFIHPFFSIL